ncbi:MAG: Omp28-related outer membrane protein [Bacteroidales bacterium]|nr:Omp28-related outer membrane protein [Bacteroidales bacterium]
MASCKPMDKPSDIEPDKVDWSKDFYHKSFVMKFTANWCGFCPRMADAVALAQEQNPDKIVLMDIHGSNDPLVFDDATVLMKNYGVGGYPTGFFDFRYEVQNGSSEQVARQLTGYLTQAEQNSAGSAISYKSSFSGNKLDIHLFLYLRQATDYKVSVFLLEDGLVAKQSNYLGESDDNYVHKDVARVSVTAPLGDAFSTTEENSIKRFDYSVEVASGYKKENLKILVFVQRILDEKFYVDNCAIGKAGENLSLKYSI